MTNSNRNSMVEGQIALGLFLDEVATDKVLVNGVEVALEVALDMVNDVQLFMEDDDDSCTVVIGNEEVVFEFI